MKKNIQIWNAKGVWYVTTWRESKRGGKRRNLKTREARPEEIPTGHQYRP